MTTSSDSLRYKHLEHGKYLLVRESGDSKWVYVEDKDRKKTITTYRGVCSWHYADLDKCDHKKCYHGTCTKGGGDCTVVKEGDSFYLLEDEDKKMYDTCPSHSYGDPKRDKEGEWYRHCVRCDHKSGPIYNSGN